MRRCAWRRHLAHDPGGHGAVGALHDRLWAQAVVVVGQSPNSIVGGLFIQSLNEMIDL